MVSMNAVWHIGYFDLTVRLLLAAALGGAIGLEREWSNRAAGFRTHILVCIGSAAIMLLSIYGFSQFVSEPSVRTDPARLAAQVISGIGFLGAGAILRNGSSVTGLTTAASIWVVAAIGLCVGAGFLYCALLATVLVLVSLFLLNRWENRLMRSRRSCEIVLGVKESSETLAQVVGVLGANGVQISSVKINSADKKQLTDYAEAVSEITVGIKSPNPGNMLKAMQSLSSIGAVVSLETNYSLTGTVAEYPGAQDCLTGEAS